MAINKDIGFIVSNNHIYNNLHNLFLELIQNDPVNQYLCFTYNNSINTNKLNMPILPLSEAKFWQGRLFVFDLEVIDIVKNFPGIDQIYYFLQHPEWMNYAQVNHFDLRNIYAENEKISVIAQNYNIYNIYQRCWNKKPIGVMEVLSYENFKNIIFTT
jgi:hypothetical protein